MWYVPYVGFTTYRRATVMTRLYCKRLMFMQMFCKKKKIINKKKTGRHNWSLLVARMYRPKSQILISGCRNPGHSLDSSNGQLPAPESG